MERGIGAAFVVCIFVLSVLYPQNYSVNIGSGLSFLQHTA